jgi:hypothetical protein
MIVSSSKNKYLHSDGVCIQTSVMILGDLKGSRPGRACDVFHIEQCNVLFIMYIIMFSIFDAEQSGIVSIKNYVLSCTTFNIE